MFNPEITLLCSVIAVSFHVLSERQSAKKKQFFFLGNYACQQKRN